MQKCLISFDEEVESETVLSVVCDVQPFPSANYPPVLTLLEPADDCAQSIDNSQNGAKNNGQTDSGISVTDGCGPNEYEDDSVSKNLDTPLVNAQDSRSTTSSDSDRSDDINTATESESDLSSHVCNDECTDSCSSCSDNAQSSESDKSEESDGRMTESETDESSCSIEEHQNQDMDSDSDSDGSYSCENSAHCSDMVIKVMRMIQMAVK